MLALVAVAIAAVVSGDRDAPLVADASATTITAAPTTSVAPTTVAPGSTTVPDGVTPTTTGVPSEFDRQLDSIIAFIERERGLKFKHRPVVIAMGEDDFVARFEALNREHYEKHQTDYETATVVFSALGLLRNNLTYYETSQAFGSAGVLGFYDPKTAELAVRGNTMTPFVRTVVAHELTHALDDQWFRLDRPEYDDAKDEVAFGFSALAEGNARRVENAYRASLSAAERASASREEASYGANFSANMFTTTFLKLQLAPYTLGELFVGELYESGGQAALDAAFAAPPRTSRQVIDVDAYLAKQAPVSVTPPPAEGTVVDDGLFGQVVLQYLLETVVPSAQAKRAATGWAGDWYVAWRNGTASCLRAVVAMETSGDANDLRTALDRWVATRPKGSVSATGTEVTFTACTG